MNIRNKIENSKTLLFTSLVAVALLGATQPVSAETYTSRNFDWSGDDWSGDDWPEDDWSGDGLSKYDRSGVGLSQYGWSKYGWSSDKEEWPEDDWSSDKEEWPEDDWSSDKKDETEDKTRPPYGEALGTGYEKRDDWGGPGTVATDPYTPPYGGALGTGYEKRDDWRGPGHIPKPENEQSPNPSHIPEPPQIEWPQWNGFDGLSSGPSDWGQSEDTPRFPSEPRVTEKPQHTPQKNPQESDFDRGFSAGLKAKNSGRGIDFEGFQYGGWSDEYKKGYMQAFGTPYTPSAT
ncbi:TPA: lysis inhibitor protein [Streptococcus pyogenes]|nr:lysis inhibitor protein [Streptococcus pyogenes]HER4293887.1 lysis inhibitor protein [Streptococcus pyogenes]HER4321864.1 lysis inhibitor protein [Streptococcus pyogenes]